MNNFKRRSFIKQIANTPEMHAHTMRISIKKLQLVTNLIEMYTNRIYTSKSGAFEYSHFIIYQNHNDHGYVSLALKFNRLVVLLLKFGCVSHLISLSSLAVSLSQQIIKSCHIERQVLIYRLIAKDETNLVFCIPSAISIHLLHIIASISSMDGKK